ncbi:MAG: hypothetical protein KC776_01060 [Myxococcales bacterium]|nr:hypothetical protein [Myxococcales bacterium]MCB9576539.1 hypothetical protein [Polyangiaceae bacterium]
MRRLALALLLPAFTGCVRSPPPSQFPTADKALERMHETYACSRGVQGEAKIDYFSDEGRVRGSVLYKAALPEKLRFDVFSPFGVTLSTLTSDGTQFALYDLKEKAFLTGPANACNVARFTRVPVPPFAMAQLLRGEAPVLVHTPQTAQIAWEGGRYVVRIQSKHDAQQEIELEPTDADFNLPWEKQRVRVLGVTVTQQGYDLYHAELADHEPAQTSKPWVDPEGLSPTVMPSGPPCSAEVPRRMRLEVPDTDQDVIFRVKEVVHNPPIDAGTFQQSPRPGVKTRYSACGG